MVDLVATFGSIPVNSTSEQELIITNSTEDDVEFILVNLSLKLSIDSCFYIKFPKNKKPLLPGKTLKFVVYFSPLIPNMDYIDYYALQMSNSSKIVSITLQGSCSGPNISFDRNRISFNSVDKSKKTLHLVNDSLVSTKFQWFTNVNGQGPFMVSPMTGEIEPDSSFQVHIRFNENYCGNFFNELICLMNNHEPLILKVKGKICNLSLTTDDDDDDNDGENETPSSENPFEALLGDSLSVRSSVPIASSSCTYLDFGLGNASNMKWNITHILSISNHLDTGGYFSWNNDVTFLVEPATIFISGGGVAEFTVKFRPRSNGTIFSSILFGDFSVIDLNSKKQQKFRIPVTGHTLLEPSQITPIFYIPKNVIFPPTIPCQNVYTNFLIENRSQIPMLFKFVEPKISHFAVMPICGVVDPRSWCIISAALQPQCCGYFVEEWKVQIDLCSEVQIMFYGKAEVCNFEMVIGNNVCAPVVPILLDDCTNRIELGDSDPKSIEIKSEVEEACKNFFENKNTSKTIVFAITHPGCESKSVLYIQNTTRNVLRMSFFYDVDWIGMGGIESIDIRQNEIFSVPVIFHPSSIGVYQSNITLSTVMIIERIAVGKSTKTILNVEGICNIAKIMVDPETMDLGVISCFSENMVQFKINNVDRIPLFYNMCLDLNIATERFPVNERAISIHPKKGAIYPGETRVFTICFKPENTGLSKLQVTCYICKNSHGKEIIAQKIKKCIVFNLFSEVFHPTLQIFGIRSIDCPNVYSQSLLWKILNIDKLNETLKAVEPDSVVCVNMEVPAGQVGSEALRFALIVKNVTSFQVDWTLKRVKMCECPLLKNDKSLTFNIYKYACPHRLILKLSPQKGKIQKNTIFELYLDVNYNLVGNHTLSYILTINNRIINMMISISITEDICDVVWPFYYETDDLDEQTLELKYGRVSIKNLDVVYKWLLIHNTCGHHLTWMMSFDSDDADDCIQCITQTCEAAPDQLVKILFSFKPTELLNYKKHIIGSLNKRQICLVISGEGTFYCPLDEPPLDIPDCILYPKKYIEIDKDVHLSTSYIFISKIQPQSSNTQIFALNNPTKKTIKYTWNTISIPHSIECSIKPSEGILKPFESKWFILRLDALNISATITFHMRCIIFDYSGKRHMIESKDCKVHFTDSEITLKREFDAKMSQTNKIPEIGSLWMAVTVKVITLRNKNQLTVLDKMKLSPIDNEYGKSSSDKKETIGTADAFLIMRKILREIFKSDMIKYHYMEMNTSNIPTYAQLIGIQEKEKTILLNNRYIAKIFSNWIYEIIHKVLIVKRCHCNKNNCKCNVFHETDESTL